MEQLTAAEKKTVAELVEYCGERVREGLMDGDNWSVLDLGGRLKDLAPDRRLLLVRAGLEAMAAAGLPPVCVIDLHNNGLTTKEVVPVVAAASESAAEATALVLIDNKCTEFPAAIAALLPRLKELWADSNPELTTIAPEVLQLLNDNGGELHICGCDKLCSPPLASCGDDLEYAYDADLPQMLQWYKDSALLEQALEQDLARVEGDVMVNGKFMRRV